MVKLAAALIAICSLIAIGLGVCSAPRAGAIGAVLRPDYSFCGVAESIVGIGTGNQASIQNNLFIPKYVNACAKGLGKVSYQANGDSGAVQAAIYHTHALMASDVPLSAQNKLFAENDTCCLHGATSLINQMPVYVDGLAVAYNLGACNFTGTPKLSGVVLSLMYTGRITQWNDTLITRDNPGLASCSLKVRPAVRYDVAGSTTVFKDYLSKWNPAFAPYTNENVNTTWPATLTLGCRGIGESGMATCLGVSGAVGYVQFKQAVASGLKWANVQNGNPVPTYMAPAPAGTSWPKNCQAAASAAVTPPTTDLDWSTVSITNPTDGYAICMFSYEFAFSQPRTAQRWMSQGQVYTLIDYLTTVFSDTVQKQLTGYGVAPLPSKVLAISRAGIDNIGMQ